MRRVYQYHFYQLGSVINPLTQFKGQPTYSDIWLDCLSAHAWLNDLLSDRLVPVVTSRSAAARLRSAVEKINGALSGGSPEPTIEERQEMMASQAAWFDVQEIVTAARDFETVFAAELETIDTYYVSEKGIYSTNRLIESADLVFSPEVRNQLSATAIEDIRQAGRCLAFDLDTACGFHMVRATETIIHKYYCEVTQATPKRKDRNWGAYVRNLNRHLKQSGSAVDPKLVALIDQIREHHRNPVMHPEISLTADEAQSLFSICQAVIITFAVALAALPAAHQLQLRAVGGQP
jgi:hypothetical protein